MAPNTTIEIVSGPDHLGRHTFFASWPSDNKWRGGSGTQSQIFVTDLAAFVARTGAVVTGAL